MGKLLWKPSSKRVSGTLMKQFFDTNKVANFAEALKWSIDSPAEFWSAVWDATGIIGDKGRVVAVADSTAPLGMSFFPEARLNVVDTLLHYRLGAREEAIIYLREDGLRESLSWAELELQVRAVAEALRKDGVVAGDRVAAWMPNVPETIVMMFAAQSLGAVFTSTSADFGVEGVVDRFSQTEPVVLLASTSYMYGGKVFDCNERLAQIAAKLPSVRRVVVVDRGQVGITSLQNATSWNEYVSQVGNPNGSFAHFDFNHPGLILYSSGTTGKPKCIVHRAAGVLLTHMKEQQLHCDVKPGDTVLYFTTCGWMMWNWLTSVLASGATAVLYDGNPVHPHNETLFDICEQESVTLFGTSAKFIDTSLKSSVKANAHRSFSTLRTICSTGSPLNESGFKWVYENVKTDVHLASISGGTDLCGCFVGGDPTRPVFAGEIQGPMLGMNVNVYDDQATPVRNQTGELVCLNAFPSIPLGFWGDHTGEKFRDTYFSRFPNTWTHGDFASFTKNDGVIIHGRSDATLNVGGVRIGTAEIYSQVESFSEVGEAVAVAQNWADDTRIILFVRLITGYLLTDDLQKAIKSRLRSAVSPRHVPALIVSVADIPRTRSGKISELAIADVVNGRPVRNTEALANPECLALFSPSTLKSL